MKNVVYPVALTRNKSNQLVIEITVSRAIENRLLKRATHLGLSLADFIQKQVAMLAGYSLDNRKELKRAHLINDWSEKLEETTEDQARRSLFFCPHCLNKVYKQLKDYGKLTKDCMSMHEFCTSEAYMPQEVVDYLSPLTDVPSPLLSLIGTSNGELNAVAKINNRNYYRIEDLKTFVLPRIEAIQANIRELQQGT